MNKKSVRKEAVKNTPHVEIIKHQDWFRHDVISELVSKENIGIELGVAEGGFAKRMISSGKFRKFFGVDQYGDIHDTREYLNALKSLDFTNENYFLIRCDFSSALDLFEDNFFDFIYVDGFAHTGEEGGKTLIDWYPKLKTGGILAGDDYHEDWPLVVWAVNDLAQQLQCEVNITTKVEHGNYNKYPSWFIKKRRKGKSLFLNQHLYKLAMREKARVRRYRVGPIRNLVRFLGLVLEKVGLKQTVLHIIKNTKLK